MESLSIYTMTLYIQHHCNIMVRHLLVYECVYTGMWAEAYSLYQEYITLYQSGVPEAHKIM